MSSDICMLLLGKIFIELYNLNICYKANYNVNFILFHSIYVAVVLRNRANWYTNSNIIIAEPVSENTAAYEPAVCGRQTVPESDWFSGSPKNPPADEWVHPAANGTSRAAYTNCTRRPIWPFQNLKFGKSTWTLLELNRNKSVQRRGSGQGYDDDAVHAERICWTERRIANI